MHDRQYHTDRFDAFRRMVNEMKVEGTRMYWAEGRWSKEGPWMVALATGARAPQSVTLDQPSLFRKLSA